VTAACTETSGVDDRGAVNEVIAELSRDTAALRVGRGAAENSLTADSSHPLRQVHYIGPVLFKNRVSRRPVLADRKSPNEIAVVFTVGFEQGAHLKSGVHYT
jgi:hypothetical protein